MRFRPLSPWILAAALCLVFAVLFWIVFTALPAKLKQEIAASEGTMIAGKSQMIAIPSRSSMNNSIVALLSFVPNGAKRVPLVAAMIENHEDARLHQQGLQDAIAVFELIVEGDITRFMALFRKDRLPKMIGPVRSLREHFVSIALGYKPLLLHAGGHPLAYEALSKNPKLIHHDGIRFDGETFERDPLISAPHNLFLRKAALQGVLEDSTIEPYPLPLFPTCGGLGSCADTGEKAEKISINMGSPKHDVTFLFKSLQEAYVRSIAGAPKQAQPKTVAILETTVEGFHQQGYIPWTQTVGGGKLLLFRGGRLITGKWTREKNSPFALLDEEGKNIAVPNGQIWITMLPTLSMVKWE